MIPRARRARRERSEALGRDIHRIDAPGAAHQHRGRERLAAGAGAIVGDHLAAARREQPGEKLTALVLNFNQTLGKKRMTIDRRLSGDAQPRRRVWRGLRLDALGGEALLRGVAFAAREIDAQVERRRVQQSVRDAQRLFIAVLAGETFP